MILFTDLLQRGYSAYPIVDSNDVKGGLWTVDNILELETLKTNHQPKLKLGMLVYVTSLDVYYQWKNNDWEPAQLGGGGTGNGLPVYTETMYNNLSTKPSEYLLIRDTDQDTIIQSSNLIDILFQAIRKLQAEVARLNNSFKYGINSYTETNTAMSSVSGSYDSVEEDEPLWSLEEEDLIPQEGATIPIDFTHGLDPKNHVDDTEENVLKFKGLASYIDKDGGFLSITDPKTIIFITSNSLNILFKFKDGMEVNLNNLTARLSVLYNILIVYSKKTSLPGSPDLLYGHNYLWVQITDVKTNNVLVSGYYFEGNLYNTIKEFETSSYIDSVEFNGTEQNTLNLYKFNTYSKYLDFSYNVIPSIPQENDYKLGVAHLTIRSVSTLDVLTLVEDQLMNNELIWVEDSKKLCIRSNNKIYNIGSINLDNNNNNNNNNNTMNENELIAYLLNYGIIVEEVGKNPDNSSKYNLKLNDLSGVTFIHQETGKKFDITVDSEGNFKSLQLNDNTLEKELTTLNSISQDNQGNKIFYTQLGTTYTGLPTQTGKGYSFLRGFIGNLRTIQANKWSGESHNSDVGLNSDRLKIGAVYAPEPGTTVYGCSHAYIELENTSDKDICLEGCTLNYRIGTATGEGEDLEYLANNTIYTLPLTGTIKAGGTYLIRGKQYANFDDVNTILKVKTYDLEWYHEGQLIDLQHEALSFVLLYLHPVDGDTTYYKNLEKDGEICRPEFIDGMVVRHNVKKINAAGSKTAWVDSFAVPSNLPAGRDYVLKNTFELDPAKLAFLSLAIPKKDSSRLRGATLNDFKLFYIDKPIISFPNSDPTYDVSLITPKASFENKNISTDKTKLNKEKPNMVYCSFGIDTYKTRCFNWISVGSFDEYIWIRQSGTDTWEKFESYKGNSGEQIGTKFKRKNPGYVKMTSTGDTWKSTQDDEFNIPIEPYVYKRMLGRFPGDNSFYTSHKCMLEATNYVSTKTVYEYIVGRALIDGSPDPEHVSDVQTFTLYPKNTKSRVYLTTDQQGFYWMEYQTWAGAAKALANKIATDVAATNEMPVLLNVGDVTQNGTRVNEWLDYYLAGYDLFKQYEHMSVVGNNDLCGTDPSILGTGDDTGKSNGYYHHLFNCYEIQDNLIVNTGDTYKYIPSTYYFDADNIRYVNINSELTFINCRDWFNLKVEGDSDLSYNLYTGWLVMNKTKTLAMLFYEGDRFVPIYKHLRKWFKGGKKCIVSCHEIPFTVMTFENMTYPSKAAQTLSRSRSRDFESGALVGSHLNLLTAADTCCINWFSRLLEDCKVHLCLGGHKHTYTCTFPVREFYYYLVTATSSEATHKWNDETKQFVKITEGATDGTHKLVNSFENGPMTMPESLKDDINVIWEIQDSFFGTNSPFKTMTNGTFSEAGHVFLQNNDKVISTGNRMHTSRIPLVLFDQNPYIVKDLLGKGEAGESAGDAYSEASAGSCYLPSIKDNTSYTNSAVVYFMCLATGYKQTSNKELPGFSQTFSKVLPLSYSQGSTYAKPDIKASKEQQAPMFAEAVFDGDDYTLKLFRVMNIQSGLKKPIYPDTYSTATPKMQTLNVEGSRFGTWQDGDTNSIISGQL